MEVRGLLAQDRKQLKIIARNINWEDNRRIIFNLSNKYLGVKLKIFCLMYQFFTKWAH